MDVIAGIDAARARWNVLEHPFYTRWEQGELTRGDLARYAGEYRHAVVALARAARTARMHADEEAEHIALWDDFSSALGVNGDKHEPLAQTRCCASAWSAAGDEVEAAAILYAIEAGQPAISETKLRGLVDHYGFESGSPGTAYFELHSERDHEHAAEARARLEDADDARLVALAESALAANWALLDGVAA
jgi:pyrroloquinoline-quinone synthase